MIPIAFYCEKKSRCSWQCFTLHQGLGWGPIPDPESCIWREWHDKECGGKLIPLYGEVEENGHPNS